MSQQFSKSIFLTGFMGAGKSTVGRLLAEMLNKPFIDLDARIVEREQRSIATIFAEQGEDYFRDCETSLLQTLEGQTAAVFATGGGMAVRAVNRDAMARLGQVVYLDASWATIKERLQGSVDRPLVEQHRNWAQLKSLWDKRQVFYRKADIIVSTDGLAPLDIAQNIADQLSFKE